MIRTQPLMLMLFTSVLLLTGCRQRFQELSAEVIASFPHDPTAYTQGLLFYKGRLFESTGISGASSVREVVIESGNIERLRPLEPQYFGEGLARVGNRLIQLTWQRGRAFVYDLETFDPLGAHRYVTEGWGLCYDGDHLYMTDGSSTLFRRDPDSFEEEESVTVKLRGEPLIRLNELECVGEHVYANVWLTDTIVRIDKRSGRVVAEINASGLLSDEERDALLPGEVLNGIAYNAESETFYLTGKHWPRLFEVRWVARPSS